MNGYEHIHTCPHCGSNNRFDRIKTHTTICLVCNNSYKAVANVFELTPTNPGACPTCGSSNIEASDFEQQNTAIIVKRYICNDCSTLIDPDYEE